MKRHIIKLGLARVMAIGAFIFSQTSKQDSYSDLALNNIEALAGGEVSVDKPCMWSEYSWCMWFYPDEIIEAESEFRN